MKKLVLKFIIRPGSVLLLLLAVSGSCSRVQTEVTIGELTYHIKYLSSDSLKGRETGSPGDSLAAEYIREKFTEYGLKPLSGDGMQRFDVVSRIAVGKDNFLSVNGEKLKPGIDFMPASFTANGSLDSDIVFAGYGFNINNDSIKWEDYSGIDIKGKWVLVLRADPEPDNSMSKYLNFSGDRDKAMIAKDMGAAGMLLVSGIQFDNQDILDPPSEGDFTAGIPVLKIKRDAADLILSGSGYNIEDLEKKLNSSRKPFSFHIPGKKINGSSEIVPVMVKTRNVVMMLPGSDPVLKDEYVIFGAHFDHLGMGGSSSSRAPDTVAVHYGADDNASGTAMVIELAGKMAGNGYKIKRSLVFAAFSGEEKGLLGSKYFSENPDFDLSKTVAMFNFDMVGRLKESKELSIGGVGTAEKLKKMVEEFSDTLRYEFVFTEEGSGPSDHSSFYAKNIPVLFFSTGAHTDYHTPGDTWDKINYEGMVDISDLSFSLASRIASDSTRLSFRESGPKEGVSMAVRRRGVSLGIMPDFAGAVKNGLRADLVTPGKPAAIGGMKKGDIIVAINGKPVNNIYDYMFRLNQLKWGETISVEIIRNEKKEVLIIKL